MSDLYDQYSKALATKQGLPGDPGVSLYDQYASKLDPRHVVAPPQDVPAWSGAPVTIDRTVRDAMVEFSKGTADPVAEQAKIDTSIYYAQALSIPFEQVYSNYEAVNKAWHGQYVEPTTALQGIKQQADYAMANRRLNLLYLQMANGDESPALFGEIAKAESSLPEPDQIRRGLPAEIGKWFAEQAPALTTSAQLGLAAGLGAAAIGGVAGSVVPVLGNAVGAAGGFVVGLSTGFTVGISQDMMKQGQGAAFRDLATIKDAQGNTMDLNTARWASLAIGAVYGALGTVQISNVPGIRQAAVLAMDEAVKSIVVKGLMRTAGGIVTETGKSALMMGGLGGSQAMVDVAVKEWAKAFANKVQGTTFDPATLSDITQQVTTAALESAKAGLVMGLPGSIAEAARGIKADIPRMVEEAGNRIGALSAQAAPAVEVTDRPTIYQPAAHAITEENGVRTLTLTDPALTDRPRIDYAVQGNTVHVRTVYVPAENAAGAADAVVALMHENPGKTIDWQPADAVGAGIRQKLLDENPLRKQYQAIAEAKASEAAAIREAMAMTTDPSARAEMEQEAARVDAEAMKAQADFAGMDIQWFSKEEADLRAQHLEEARQSTDFGDFVKMQEGMRAPGEPVQSADYWHGVWQEAKSGSGGIDPETFNKRFMKELNDPAVMANLVREMHSRGVARDISTDLERIGYAHASDTQPLQDAEMVKAKAAVRRNIDAIKEYQASLGDEAMQRQIDYERTVPDATETRLRRDVSRLMDEKARLALELDMLRERHGVPVDHGPLEAKLAEVDSKLKQAEDAITSARGEANIVARIAKKEGRTEAMAGIAERVQKAKDNARAAQQYIYDKRQEAINERLYRGHLVDGIRKAEGALNDLNPQYVKPIRDLLTDIETRGSGRGAKRNLQELKDQIKAMGDPDFTDAMIEDLTALEIKHLTDMSTPELETLSDAVKYYYKLARDQMRIWKNGKWEDYRGMVERSTKQMRSAKGVEEGFLSTLGKEVSTENTQGEKARFSVKRIWDTLFGIGQLHYDYMIERLAGVNSELHRVFVRAMEAGRDAALAYKRDAIETFHADVQALGEKNLYGWLTETRKSGRFTFTRGERLALYMHALNSDNLSALTNAEKGGFGLRHKLGNENTPYKITREEVAQIGAELSDKERMFVEAAQKLFKKQGLDVGSVFLQRNNFAMHVVDNYYPKDVMAAARGRDIEGESALDELKLRQLMPGIPKGFTKERVGSVLPVYLNNIMDDIVSSVNKSANYIGFEMPMASAIKLLRDGDVRAHMDALYGGRVWKEIKKGLADIAGELKSYDEISTFFRKLKQKAVTAGIGFNPFTPLKQPISYLNASVYVKGQYLTQALVDVAAHGKAIRDMHLTYSPKFWDRLNVGFTRDIAEQSKTTREMARSMVGGTPLEGAARAGVAIKKASFAGVKAMDERTISATMRGAWLQAMDEMKDGHLTQKVAEGLDVAEIPSSFEDRNRLAYKYADYVTARTQDMALPEYRSGLSRSTSDLAQFFTMFGSSTNQNLNLVARTIREARTTGNYKPLMKALFSIAVVQPILEAGVNALRDTMTKKNATTEEARRAFILNVLQNETSSIYFLRDLTNAVANRLGGYTQSGIEIVPTRVLNQTLDAMWQGYTAMAEPDYLKKRAKLLKFLNQTADLALMWSEVPLVVPKGLVEKALK